MTVKIFTGDCREILKALPDESVHCVVTSPPYWGLRDYGIAGQLGMERSLGEYIDTMVAVFAEVKRVLRSDGTLWLNLGDSYAANMNGRSAAETKALGKDDRTFRDKPFSTIGPIIVDKIDNSRPGKSGNFNNLGSATGSRIAAAGNLKPKDLCGIPWRVALALQNDGWWLRQDIIWSKPNPMPESVTDRCTKAHEYIFLLSKSARYYYDADAIAEPALPASLNRYGYAADDTRINKNGAYRDAFDAKSKYIGLPTVPDNPQNRNKRSVWTVATQPYSEAHFATFPTALIEPCILAGCPKGGTVLDPFAGAGTTGVAVDRLSRNAILIELNPEYVAMAERRIKDDAGMFADLQTSGVVA